MSLGGWVRAALRRLSTACRSPPGGRGGGRRQAPLARAAGRAARPGQAGSAVIGVWGAAGPPSRLVSAGRRGLREWACRAAGCPLPRGAALRQPVPAVPPGLGWLRLLSRQQVPGEVERRWRAEGVRGLGFCSDICSTAGAPQPGRGPRPAGLCPALTRGVTLFGNGVKPCDDCLSLPDSLHEISSSPVMLVQKLVSVRPDG